MQDNRRNAEEVQRYRLMEEMEENRDRRLRRAFRGAGYGEDGPGGLGRHDPGSADAQDISAEPVRRPASWRGHGEQTGARSPARVDHRGRGPRGYRRSDARITEDLNDRLTDDPHLDASEIQVSVSAGEVTLTGTVDGRAARRRAEDIAEAVSGVTYVLNNLRVRQAGTSGAVG